MRSSGSEIYLIKVISPPFKKVDSDIKNVPWMNTKEHFHELDSSLDFFDLNIIQKLGQVFKINVC